MMDLLIFKENSKGGKLIFELFKLYGSKEGGTYRGILKDQRLLEMKCCNNPTLRNLLFVLSIVLAFQFTLSFCLIILFLSLFENDPFA